MENEKDHGTEANGTLSTEYCWHCYQNGSFTNPFYTLADMQNHVRHAMQTRHMDNKDIYHTVNLLPELKRWEKPAKI